MAKLIGILIIAGVLLVAAFFIGYVVGTTVSPLQSQADANAPAASVLEASNHD